MSSNNLNNINFGEIKNITLTTNWSLEPLIHFAYSELAGDTSHWEDLYNNGDGSRMMRMINLPQSIDVKVEYDKHILKWQCFQTKAFLENTKSKNLSYDTLVELWEATPTKPVRVTSSQENWYKEIYGLKFIVASLTYKKELTDEKTI